MKRIVLTAAFAALGSASALAADLPARTYAKAQAAPAYNWSGWYGGLNAGWGGGSGSVGNNASIVSNSTFPANAEAMALGATNMAGASSGFFSGFDQYCASGDQSCEQMRLAGKKSAGRSLDGIEHNKMPLDKLALEQFGLRAAITGIALPKGE